MFKKVEKKLKAIVQGKSRKITQIEEIKNIREIEKNEQI